MLATSYYKTAVKIVVTSTGKKSKSTKYTIDVLDGEHILHTETAIGIVERDKIVWNLAELYDILDIDLREGKEDFKLAEIPTIPVLEEDEANEFFEDNSEFVYERILEAVTEGIKLKRETIRLFELNGTGVYITSNKVDWKNGVQQALDYYITMEQYDKCIIARQLLLDI
jgi:hypothetical protein